jgi:hypothetical protein
MPSIGRFTPKGVADEKAMVRLCKHYTSLGREPDCTLRFTEKTTGLIGAGIKKFK